MEEVVPIMDFDGRDVWQCGNCHRNIFHPEGTHADIDSMNYYRFCHYCGKKIKWPINNDNKPSVMSVNMLLLVKRIK